MDLLVRGGVATGAGLLLALAFTGTAPWLVWFAVAPCLYLVAAAARRREAALLAALFVAAWVFPSLFFVSRTTAAGMVLLCVYTGLGYVAALLAARALARRGVWAAVFGVAAAWALVEIGRSRIPVFGFPWLLLGHLTGESRCLRQCADLLGVYGLSFLAAAVNAALAFLATPLVMARGGGRPQGQPIAITPIGQTGRFRRIGPTPGGDGERKLALAMVLALLTASELYGGWRLAHLAGRLRPGPFIALVQGCAYRKIDRTEEEKLEQLGQHLRLHAEAARPDARGERPGLICWAETAVPGRFNQDDYGRRFREGVRAAGVATCCGADWVSPEDLKLPIPEQRWYNAAFILSGSGEELGRYAKRRLVPFGEYVPFKTALPFLSVLTTVTRDAYAPGEEPSPIVAVAGARFSLCICIEDCHPDLAREAAFSGASALLNVTNDAWFWGTHAPASHLQAARFRAVETRRPLVRATNSGISAHVDPLGDVQVPVPPDTPGVGRFRLALLDDDPSVTLAMLLGEGGAAVLFAALLGLSWWLSRESGALPGQRCLH